jgi:hypothetical protein
LLPDEAEMMAWVKAFRFTDKSFIRELETLLQRLSETRADRDQLREELTASRAAMDQLVSGMKQPEAENEIAFNYWKVVEERNQLKAELARAREGLKNLLATHMSSAAGRALCICAICEDARALSATGTGEKCKECYDGTVYANDGSDGPCSFCNGTGGGKGE